ncbi:MAG TPA: hypothetical protein VL400_06430, partial [Polyangiaceae bacterium]|nr:hypothetical protein [Polyangiaceae bacterium]
SLDEMDALSSLRDDGLLVGPTYVPGWLRKWDDLLTHFAFSRALAEIDLGHVAKRFAWLAGAAPEPTSATEPASATEPPPKAGAPAR